VREYYEASGKPWNNPRLSEAEKYTTRYAIDEAFRDREKEKTRMYKFSHPQIVAGWENHPANRRKWNQAAITADGTVTKQVVLALITQKHCAWCGCEINKDTRHIDHITPISKGGAHTESNLVAACVDCNKAKGSKLLFQWLPMLSEKLRSDGGLLLAEAA
jgi:5-methylcytosine-specific restriction endonuclease McrA